jgi:hypothetical protein
MNLGSDRADRFGQALFDALLGGFDHAWAQVDFDEDLPEADGPSADRGRQSPIRGAGRPQ